MALAVTNMKRTTDYFILDHEGCLTSVDGIIVGVVMQEWGDFYVDFATCEASFGIRQMHDLIKLLESLSG